jgi:hypothetical protein
MVYTLGFGQGFVIYHFHQRSRKKGSSVPIIWNVSSIMVPNVNHIYQVDDFWLGEMKNENIDVEIVIMIICGVFCQKVKKTMVPLLQVPIHSFRISQEKSILIVN